MGIEEVKEVKETIKNLEQNKTNATTLHRNTVLELKKEGVNEKQSDSSKRTETFNKYLNPIEEELKKISIVISGLRKENDLQQKPEEILRKKFKRLNEIAWIDVDQFLKTEVGQECYDYLYKQNHSEFTQKLSENKGVDLGRYVIEKIKEYRHLDNNQEFQEFSNRNLRVLKMIENIESKAMDMGISFNRLIS